MKVTNQQTNTCSESIIEKSVFMVSLNIFHINHGYRAAILKKNCLWLLPFYMAVASCCYYEKVRRTMRTAIVSYLFKYFYSFFSGRAE